MARSAIASAWSFLVGLGVGYLAADRGRDPNWILLFVMPFVLVTVALAWRRFNPTRKAAPMALAFAIGYAVYPFFYLVGLLIFVGRMK